MLHSLDISPEERARAVKEYLASLDQIAVHADQIPADEFEALVAEACEYVRHPQGLKR